MTLALFFAFTFAFIGYHATFFSYCCYIFNYNKRPVVPGAIFAAVGYVFWFLHFLYATPATEPYFLIVYFFLLAFGAKLTFRLKAIHYVFIALCFSINLFAKRLAVLAVIALFEGTSVSAVLGVENLRLLAIFIPLFLSISTIHTARRLIPRVSLDTILADNENVSFVTTVLTLVLGSLLVFFFTLATTDSGAFLLYQYALTGVFSIAAFTVLILYAYYLADLRISAENYRKLSQQNERDKVHIQALEEEAVRDGLTGLYTRDYADRVIATSLTQRRQFFIAFIDLDGLKIVNDTLGHDEGDWYICSVADQITHHFPTQVVSRYGGDEILIVGDYTAEDEITRVLVRCHNAVGKLSTQHARRYATSMSYGLVFKHPNDQLTAKQLISLADERMYDLKKRRGKQRKALTPID